MGRLSRLGAGCFVGEARLVGCGFETWKRREEALRDRVDRGWGYSLRMPHGGRRTAIARAGSIVQTGYGVRGGVVGLASTGKTSSGDWEHGEHGEHGVDCR